MHSLQINGEELHVRKPQSNDYLTWQHAISSSNGFGASLAAPSPCPQPPHSSRPLKNNKERYYCASALVHPTALLLLTPTPFIKTVT